ncbi:MAG: CDP-glycerol--glycerophosphate glycerophosphotransferase, partial [Crenarchaeota archaeon]|nr:CDP-glycerol--glycerophosphate glycerophosphotransferase [Thermoproteota archaeon]
MPLQNKVVASSFRGKKYLDNPKYIIEALYNMNPDLDIVWLKNKEYNYNYPSFLRT